MKPNLMFAIILLLEFNADNHQHNLEEGITNQLHGLKIYPVIIMPELEEKFYPVVFFNFSSQFQYGFCPCETILILLKHQLCDYLFIAII